MRRWKLRRRRLLPYHVRVRACCQCLSRPRPGLHFSHRRRRADMRPHVATHVCLPQTVRDSPGPELDNGYGRAVPRTEHQEFTHCCWAWSSHRGLALSQPERENRDQCLGAREQPLRKAAVAAYDCHAFRTVIAPGQLRPGGGRWFMLTREVTSEAGRLQGGSPIHPR